MVFDQHGPPYDARLHMVGVYEKTGAGYMKTGAGWLTFLNDAISPFVTGSSPGNKRAGLRWA